MRVRTFIVLALVAALTGGGLGLILGGASAAHDLRVNGVIR